MPENQSQAYLLIVLKNIIKILPNRINMYHMMGHLDDLLSWEELFPSEQVNVMADKIDGEALVEVVRLQKFTNRAL